MINIRLNRKLEDDLWRVRSIFKIPLYGLVNIGGLDDDKKFVEVNFNPQERIDSFVAFIEAQFYNKNEFDCLINKLDEAAADFFIRDWDEQVSVYLRHKIHPESTEYDKKLVRDLKQSIEFKKHLFKELYEKKKIELKDRYSNDTFRHNIQTREVKSKLENTLKGKLTSQDGNYTHKQITIAFYIMDILITPQNAKDILKKYSQTKSVEKLLQKRINKKKALISISENKTTDTKHLRDLEAAKRLIASTKKRKAIVEINHIIATFQSEFKNHY
jgi:hypothetical protein